MRRYIGLGCGLLALLALSSSGEAATVASLDFLGGDWVLLDPAGKPVGRSHVDVQLPGAMIYERRTDRDGELPVWFVNAEDRGGWVQLFPGPTGQLREFVPQSKPDAWPMVLGSEVTLRDGRAAQFRLTLSRESDNESRRLLEMSTDQGKNWSPVFDYRYVREAKP
jgi:hypothetical protein